jgi:thiol-disulfide isomerase/thioredoxin
MFLLGHTECMRFPFGFAAAFTLFVASATPTRAAAADGLPNATASRSSLGPAWLGVSMDAGNPTGVGIVHVLRGSPADGAGIRAGDRIVAVDSVKVASPASVTRVVAAHQPGETLVLAIERRGETLKLNVVLAPRPSSTDMLKRDLVGATAPAWQVTPLGAAPASLTPLRGRVVLVDFWASWCGPCRMLVPRLSALKKKFGAQGLSVVGVTTDDASSAALYAERAHMDYGVVVDSTGETTRAYGVSALPTMVLVDKAGIVRDVLIGYDPEGEGQKLEAQIRSLLDEPFVGPQ